MGYNAIYPAETIEAHRAFINRRRTLRSAEEYRTPPTPNGRTSSATSNAASSPSATAPAPTAPTLLPAAFRPGLERPAGGKSGADGVGDDQKTSSRARRISSPDMRERFPRGPPGTAAGRAGFAGVLRSRRRPAVGCSLCAGRGRADDGGARLPAALTAGGAPEVPLRAHWAPGPCAARAGQHGTARVHVPGSAGVRTLGVLGASTRGGSCPERSGPVRSPSAWLLLRTTGSAENEFDSRWSGTKRKLRADQARMLTERA